MGFFFAQTAGDARNVKRATREIPIHLMKEQGCRACSLDEVDRGRVTPKMKPSGVPSPLVYVMGSFPTEEEDAQGKHAVGTTFEATLHKALRASGMDHRDVRFGHAVRCRPTSRRPDSREVSCCSKYADEDVAESQPLLVIGFGDVAFRWATGQAGEDSRWRGRFLPINVRGHLCWYFQVQDIAYVAAHGFGKSKSGSSYERELVKVLRHDIKRALQAVSSLPARNPYVLEVQRSVGVSCIDGHNELDFDGLQDFLQEARREPVVGIDIETSTLRPYSLDRFGQQGIIATCAISTARRTLAFPVDHPKGWPEDLRRAVRVELYDFIMESHRKTAHNLAFELEWFAHVFGPQVLRGTEWADSMAAAHTLDERPGVLNLGAMTLHRFGFNVKTMSNLEASRIMEYPLATVLPYNALDAKWCRELLLDLEADIEREPTLVPEYKRKVELTPTLVLSQLRGLEVDLDYARSQQQALEDEYAKAHRLLMRAIEVQKFEKVQGRPFVVSSDEDVVTLVRDIMKRSEGEREGGRYSCDEAVLSSIPDEAGLAPKQILACRAASKLLGTYITPLLTDDPQKRIVYPDGLIHTSYNSMIAETGRLSSEGPNNQNWPKRKRKEVRGVIVSPRDHYMIACDYGQIEARVIAMASEDRVLTDALWTDFDIHGHWAARFVAVYPEIKDWVVGTFNVDWDAKGLKTLRQEAKNKWVFPQFFGSSHRSCAANLHMPDDVAERLAKEFWDQFKGVKAWQARLVQQYEKVFYVETLTGRRRRGVLSLNQIINTPVQGTAADIVTDAMTRLSVKAQVEDRPQLQPPLNVHDDLTFYIPKKTLERDVEDIAYEMCNARYSFINVPLLVEVSISKKRWHELEEVGIWRSDELGIHSRSSR